MHDARALVSSRGTPPSDACMFADFFSLLSCCIIGSLHDRLHLDTDREPMSGFSVISRGTKYRPPWPAPFTCAWTVTGHARHDGGGSCSRRELSQRR